ncbi:MAG: ChaN family lipoprotein [Reyranellaceae bacterium]
MSSAMSNAAATKTRLVPHARATWLDPQSGETVAPRALFERLLDRQAVLLGETHDVAEIHRWQMHVIAALHALKPQMAVGFEMFPKRVQPALDDWVAGRLSVDQFLLRADWNKVWRFDPEIYLPIFHFCRQHAIPMLGLNCERPLVRNVGRLGWDGIAEAEREGITRPAKATMAYRRFLFDITGGGRPDRKSKSAEDPEFDSFVNAQQTWDRAFACRIADWLQTHPGHLAVGIIGRGHLDYGGGTPHQLRDLGVADPAVLCPSFEAEIDLDQVAGIGAAIYRLDTVEERAGRVFDAGLSLAGEEAVIAEIAPDSAAAKAGLQAGDRIVAVGGAALGDAASLFGRLRRLPPGASMALTVERGGARREMVVVNA